MDVAAGMVVAERLTEVARAAFATRRLDEVTRLLGDSKKGVHRAAFANGGTSISYSWDATEDYWPGGVSAAGATDGAPFAHPSAGAVPDGAGRGSPD